MAERRRRLPFHWLVLVVSHGEHPALRSVPPWRLLVRSIQWRVSEADGAPADGSCCCTIETGPRPASLRGQQPQEEVDPVLVTILQLQWRTKGLCLFTNPYLEGVFSRASTLAAFPPPVPPPLLKPLPCRLRVARVRRGRSLRSPGPRAVAGGVR